MHTGKLNSTELEFWTV